MMENAIGTDFQEIKKRNQCVLILSILLQNLLLSLLSTNNLKTIKERICNILKKDMIHESIQKPNLTACQALFWIYLLIMD